MVGEVYTEALGEAGLSLVLGHAGLPGICGLILQEVSVVLGKLMLSTGLRNSSHLSIRLLVHF